MNRVNHDKLHKKSAVVTAVAIVATVLLLGGCSRNQENTNLSTGMELVEKYVSLKTGVRHNTKAGYQTVINLLKKDPFGSIRIGKVRISDAKMWLVKLQQKEGRGYSSIHSIRGVLRPAFQMAVDDDLIRKKGFTNNPQKSMRRFGRK